MFLRLLYIMCIYKNIKNIYLPVCKNCKFFIPYSNNPKTLDLSHCKVFGTKNIVTGEIKYEFAELCRDNEKKCGVYGKYFSPINDTSSKIYP